MPEINTPRYSLEEKEIFQTAVISVPYFISRKPSLFLAVSATNQPSPPHAVSQTKMYYDAQGKAILTKILKFQTLAQSEAFYNQQRSQESLELEEHKQHSFLCEYCKDIQPMQGILFHLNKIYISSPESKVIKSLIDETAKMVIVDGVPLEELLKDSAKDHPLLSFVDDDILSTEYYYFKWRTYAYLQGDGDKKYRGKEFSMVEGGSLWYPPPSSGQFASVKMLNTTQRQYLHLLLFELKRKRSSVEELMVFAIHFSANSVEIVAAVLLELFERLKELAEGRAESGGDLLPLVWVMSDILFNSTSQIYRRLLMRVLPFFVHFLGKTLALSAGSPSEREKSYIRELKQVVELWESKFIFEESFTGGLLHSLQRLSGVRILSKESPRGSNSIHSLIRQICERQEGQEEEDNQIEKLCLSHGVAYFQADREESLDILNEYLHSMKGQSAPTPSLMEPEIDAACDGEALTDREIGKIRSKSVKYSICGDFPVGLLLNGHQSKWTGKSISLDYE